MMTPTRIVRMIGIAGVVGWMGLVGWVAKTTLAQNGGPNPPGLTPAAVKPVEQTKAATEPPKAPSNELLPIAPVPDPSPSPPPPPLDERLAAKKEAPSPSPAPDSHKTANPAAPASEAAGIRSLPETLPAASPDDPEQSAQSFVERSQKEAEEHLKALTAEAQQLRARLAKLESGIKKWQCLVSALKSSEGQPIASTATTPGAEEAGDLEPIKPNQAGGARTDKRVKWATAASPATGASAQPGETVNPPQQLPAAQPLQVVVPDPGPR